MKLHELGFTQPYTQLPSSSWCRPKASAFSQPFLVDFNPSAADLIGLDHGAGEDQDFLSVVSGETEVRGMDPIATAYAGHQFGQFVPELGDGRVQSLGAVSHKCEEWEFQIKGAGITRYSRDGDGRTVLRSCIREYLCSEAMAGLGIPTTRALCVVGSDMKVYRERIESAGILTRLAPSHLRFGHFEYLAHQGRHDELRQLMDFTIRRHFPKLADREESYLLFFAEVLERTALLIGQWQSVGFQHGVMNTDNMSILGLTLDYGPFGFMEAYNPDSICNASDCNGRYAYRNQPVIAHWNLACLAKALMPVIIQQGYADANDVEAVFDTFPNRHAEHYDRLMAAKLGFYKADTETVELVGSLLTMMREAKADFTRTFRTLCESNQRSVFERLFEACPSYHEWQRRYDSKLERADSPMPIIRERLKVINPRFVARNHILQQAIDQAEQKDFSVVRRLREAFSDPYSDDPQWSDLCGLSPESAEGIRVSCSS